MAFIPPNPYRVASEDLANALAQLSGRSQAKEAMQALNTPYNPPIMGIAQAQQGLADWAASPNNPSNQISKSLVPYNQGAMGAAYRAGAPTATAATDAALLAQSTGRPFGPPIPMGSGPRNMMPPSGNGFPNIPPRNMMPPPGRGFGPLHGPFGPEFGPFRPQTVSNVAKAGRFANSPILQALNKIGGKGGLTKMLPGAVNPATGKLGFGTALRGGLVPGLVGTGTSMLLNALPFEDDTAAGDTRDTLADAAQWAGLGAGVGSVFGPVGTLFGGLGGGLFGAGKNIFEKDEKDPVQTTKNAFFDALETADISKEQKAAIVDQYKIMSSLAQTDEEKIAALQQAGAMVMEQAATAGQDAANAEAMLASQAMLQKFLQPQYDAIRQSSANQAAVMNSLIPSLPREFQAGARAANARTIGNADRVAAAYTQEALLAPHLANLEMQKNFDNQLFQQWKQSQYSGNAGSNDLQALIEGGL